MSSIKENGIYIEHKFDTNEWHITEWTNQVPNTLFVARTEEEAEDLVGTFMFIESMELANVLICEWDR
jgi:hypothetical protein